MTQPKPKVGEKIQRTVTFGSFYCCPPSVARAVKHLSSGMRDHSKTKIQKDPWIHCDMYIHYMYVIYYGDGVGISCGMLLAC